MRGGAAPGGQVESKHGFVVTPLLGVTLRVTHEELPRAILDALRQQGIEMNETEFSVLRYPGPEGARPIDLAQRCNKTKQAMNYVLAGLEAKGYLERRSSPGRRARTIRLTRKGWVLMAAMRRCATDTERRWAEHIGAQRFEAVRASLLDLAIWLGRIEAPDKRGKAVPRTAEGA